MSISPNVRELLLAYLLGELSLEGRHALDERMLMEQEFSDQMQDAQYDLIDDYRAGRLTPEERRRVEAALPKKELLQGISTSTEKPISSALPMPRSGVSRFKFLWAATAVSITVLALAGWLFLSRSVQPIRRTTEHMARGHAAPPANTPALSPSSGTHDTTAVLLLASDATRGAEGVALNLELSTKDILVQWVASPSATGRFRLLVSKNGKILSTVYQDGNAKLVAGRKVLEFHVPPSAFRSHASESMFLVVIQTSNAPYSVEAQFPVSVSRH